MARENLQAYPLEARGKYAIRGPTYPLRHTLRQYGATWDGDHRRWIGDVHAVRAVKAQRMFRVRVARRCHMPEEVLWAPEKEIMAGEKKLGCPLCDTSWYSGWMVAILAYKVPWTQTWTWIRDSYQWRDGRGNWHAVELVRGRIEATDDDEVPF